MSIEAAGPSNRVLSGTVMNMMFSTSQAFTGLVAMLTPNFRTFLRVLYVPNVLVLTIVWMVPESIRWLVTNGKADKAILIIIKIAKMNQIKLSEDVVEPLAIKCNDSVSLVNLLQPESFFAVLRSRILLVRLALNIFIWFMIKLIYYGMTVQSVSLAGNKYVNYILVSGVEMPAILISCLLMNWIGRKRSLCVTLLLTGVACVATDLISDEAWLVSLIVYIFGKCCVTTAFSILYIYSSEMFPTSLRHSTMNACISIGTFGAILAPFTMLLVSLMIN